MTPEDEETLLFGPGGRKAADEALERVIADLDARKAARKAVEELRKKGIIPMMATESVKESYYHKDWGSIELPRGYEVIKEGLTQDGDRVWGNASKEFSLGDRSLSSGTSDPETGKPVSDYICLVRKRPQTKAKVEAEEVKPKPVVKKLGTAEFQNKMNSFI